MPRIRISCENRFCPCWIRWRLINRPTRFARGPRRPRGGTYLRIPVAPTFQFVIGNICARACALCNFGAPRTAPWLLNHGSDINHPPISFGGILTPSHAGFSAEASRPPLPSPLCFPQRNYTVPFMYINFAAPNDASPRPLRGILEKTLETRSC